MQEYDEASQGFISRANDVEFPPLQTIYAVPPGPFLAPRNQNSDGGKPYICKSGFEDFATSSYFVTNLRQDVNHLLVTFTQEWKWNLEEKSQNEHDDDKIRTGKSKVKEYTESPFQIFKEIFQNQGWHLAQFFWSENEATRFAMYVTTIRVLAESLQSVLPILTRFEGIDVSSNTLHLDDHDTLLKACGSAFAMYMLQSTSILEERHRHTPGYGVRLSLEADLLFVLNKLPCLAKSILQEPVTQDGLRPLDDLIFVLRELQSPSDLGHRDGIQGSCIDNILPTKYGARPALIATRTTTRSEVDRERGEYGSIRISEKNFKQPLNRQEMAHTLVRKAIGLPILSRRSPNESDSSSSAHDLYLEHEKDGNAEYDPSPIHRQTTHWRSTHYVGPPVTIQQDKYSGILEGLEQVQQTYQEKLRTTFGEGGITDESRESLITKRQASKQPEQDSTKKKLKSKIMARAQMQTRNRFAQKLQIAKKESLQKDLKDY